MRTSPAALLGAALFLCAAAGLHAQAAHDALLIEPAEVNLDDPDLVLLHVGDSTEYRESHLPGARWVTAFHVSRPPTEGGLALEMLEPAALKAALESLGISDGSKIVVYMGRDPNRLARWVNATARVVYTLDHAGLGGRTRLLDGGEPAWEAAGRPISAEAVPARTGRLAPLRVRADLLVDREWMRGHTAAGSTAGFAIVDARSPSFYDGVQPDGERSGHIPGAVNLPSYDLFDGETAKLKSPAELRALFDAAGIAPGDAVVGYCHIGQYATALLFAARTLGHEVKLYDGSIQEWAKDPDAPFEVTKGSR